MMKKHLMLLALLLNAWITMAQKELSADYSYTVSDTYEVCDGFEKFYFSKNDQILTFKIKRKEIFIQKFDSKGEKIVFRSKKRYEVAKLFPKDVQLEKLMEIGNRYYLFYSLWDGRVEQLFSREIDFDKGEFIGKNTLVLKVEGKVTGSAMGAFYILPDGAAKFNFVTSKEGNKILIHYTKKPKKKRDTKSWNIIGVCLMDENANVTSQQEVKMPYTRRRMGISDYAIDAEANTYMMANVYHDDREEMSKKDKSVNYHLELFKIPAGSTEINITKIEIKDNFVFAKKLFEDKEGNIVCTGFYNNTDEYDADGIAVIKIHKEGGQYNIFTHEIPTQIVKSYLSEKERKEIDKGDDPNVDMLWLWYRDLVTNEDGSMVLFIEHFSIGSVFSPTPDKPLENTYTTNFRDILVTKIDAQGNLSWMKKLPKRQVGLQYKGGLSFKYINVGNYHYVFFLDDIKNHNLSKDQSPEEYFDGRDGYFTSFKINDTDGSYVNSPVFNLQDVEGMPVYQFGIARIVEVAEGYFAVEVYKKEKEDVMIKVHIN
ncbi:hypothetical protein [Flavobacterium beibuense]|uniref:Uncharacterized protein n=1 Tax=Flavobacterium beibuense TaxID=657326 RepID=A0A444WD93_9FLAO|nr:hypothetical protein [Flavobacterium beibuense]RYJ43769.1 hypothetical protein NU09_1277 [Flavobacterium beibuense]